MALILILDNPYPHVFVVVFQLQLSQLFFIPYFFDPSADTSLSQADGKVDAGREDDVFLQADGEVSPFYETVFKPCVVDDRDGPGGRFGGFGPGYTADGGSQRSNGGKEVGR